jgi:uncharacterized protein YbjT (DUF2867 family)
VILVVGSTGALGMEICRRLAAARKPFRAMVRSSSDPAKKEMLKQLGGELVEADLKDRASLDRACASATAVITTPTAILSQQHGDTFDSVDLHGQMKLIDAACEAKVGHFVFIPVSGNLLKHGDNPLFDAKQAIENCLRQSRLTYTILRPTCFTEIWLSPCSSSAVQRRLLNSKWSEFSRRLPVAPSKNNLFPKKRFKAGKLQPLIRSSARLPT